MAINQKVGKCLQLIVSLIKLGYVKWDRLLIIENNESYERMDNWKERKKCTEVDADCHVRVRRLFRYHGNPEKNVFCCIG